MGCDFLRLDIQDRGNEGVVRNAVLAPALRQFFEFSRDVVADRIPAALEALIAAQADDGGWPWNDDWNWGFVDKAAWNAAERDWRGSVTREALETLLAWGRVAAA